MEDTHKNRMPALLADHKGAVENLLKVLKTEVETRVGDHYLVNSHMNAVLRSMDELVAEMKGSSPCEGAPRSDWQLSQNRSDWRLAAPLTAVYADQAVAIEREACAKLLDAELELEPDDGTVETKFYRWVLRHLARQMRARKSA